MVIVAGFLSYGAVCKQNLTRQDHLDAGCDNYHEGVAFSKLYDKLYDSICSAQSRL